MLQKWSSKCVVVHADQMYQLLHMQIRRNFINLEKIKNTDIQRTNYSRSQIKYIRIMENDL
jgi:hypothetical protein